MPVRAVLNVVYVLLTKNLDEKQRREFDDELYGWGAQNEAANEALHSGGED